MAMGNGNENENARLDINQNATPNEERPVSKSTTVGRFFFFAF
jgi:hypothetical protein